MGFDTITYNILIIEDNPGDLFLIKEYLEEFRLPPFVMHANNFSEAQYFLTNNDNNFDVVLLDLSLPDKNGEELVLETKKISHNIPVIILTGYTDLAFAAKALSYGISDYLLKENLNSVVLHKTILYSIERNKILVKLSDNETFIKDVFNSLNSHIAVIDENGTILSTNEAWKNFSSENDSILIRLSEGANYFEYYEKLSQNGDDIAHKVLSGIKSVLSNKTNQFHLEFPCLTKNGELWFMMIANLFKGTQTRVVIRNADITERKETQTKIANAAIESQEEEKKNIARELHDNLGQKLLALKLFIDTLDVKIQNDNSHTKELVNNIKDIIHNAINETRTLSHQLMPPEFADFGLYDAIEVMIAKLKLVDVIDYDIIKEGIEIEPSNIIKINLYRVVQEFILNSQKYSNATKIKIHIWYIQNRMQLFLSDNGIGFDLEQIKKDKKGLGLLNIFHRLEAINAVYDYKTQIGKGVELSISVPLTA